MSVWLYLKAHHDGQVVADAAVVGRADVGAARLLAAIGFVGLEEEGEGEDGGG